MHILLTASSLGIFFFFLCFIFLSTMLLQEDVFSIKARDLGKLIKLNIRHDNSNLGSDWFLDRVDVYDSKRKTK